MAYAKMTTVAQRLAIVSEWERSGQGTGEFCRQRGINEATFGWWRRGIARSGKQSSTVELVEINAKRSSPKSTVEVVLPNGIVVRVPGGFDRRSLDEILAVVRAC